MAPAFALGKLEWYWKVIVGVAFPNPICFFAFRRKKPELRWANFPSLFTRLRVKLVMHTYMIFEPIMPPVPLSLNSPLVSKYRGPQLLWLRVRSDLFFVYRIHFTELLNETITSKSALAEASF